MKLFKTEKNAIRFLVALTGILVAAEVGAASCPKRSPDQSSVALLGSLFALVGGLVAGEVLDNESRCNNSKP